MGISNVGDLTHFFNGSIMSFKKMKIVYWLIGIAVLAGFFYLIFVGGSAPALNPPLQEGVVHSLDHVKGNASSTVVVVEYSDFQCPACKAYYPIVREIISQYGDKIAFVYRHFPLVTIHVNAEFAARAAEAAGKQGKFWEMHDLLFEKQDEWAQAADPITYFESYASLIGISVDQFKADFVSREVRDLIKAERLHGLQIGLQGTPTFFVNGVQIQNPKSFEEFKDIINGAVQEKSK